MLFRHLVGGGGGGEGVGEMKEVMKEKEAGRERSGREMEGRENTRGKGKGMGEE